MSKSSKQDQSMKRFTLPLTYDIWREIKQISYDQQRSMNCLAREAMNHIIKKYGKNKLEIK